MKWTVAAGAAFGVSRSKVFDILSRSGGNAMADTAACHPTNRSVHIIAGNGGFAWFQLLWPHNDVAAARNNAFAFHAPGQETMAQGTAKPLTLGPQAPWKNLPGTRQVSAFMCGNNETHTAAPTSVLSLNGNNIISVASALQAASSSVIPMITIGVADAGTAPGAARPANVGNADGVVNLFNSAASRAGGLLSNASDATLYKAHYDAFAQLNRAAERSTQRGAYQTASSAAQFLGTNLSAKLQITQADLDRYGIDGTTRANVRDIGRAFIVAVKAFKMGLTNAIALPAMRDDPHGAFADGSAMSVPPMLKKIFDGFMTDLKNTIDDNTGQVLADDTVITICGDTTKTPLNRAGWGDGTPNNSNVIWVYSAGHLKSGWFGGTTRAGTAQGFDAAGNTAAYNGTTTARMALASVAYAVAKRDDRAINTFANGITVAGVFGRLKDL